MQVETTIAKATKIRINFNGLLIRMESPFRVFQIPVITTVRRVSSYFMEYYI
jgi:hypothetical protein